MCADMASERSRPVDKRFPAAAWIASGLPLAMIWVVLLLTGAVPGSALAGIGVAVIVLVLFVGLSANHRIRRGR